MVGLDVRGQWWLPGAEQSAVHGRLVFSQEEGGELDLAGQLADPSEAGKGSGIYPLIHGLTDDGPHTLIDCYRLRASLSLAQPPRYETIRVNQIVRDAFYGPEDMVGGTAVAVGLARLAAWIGDTGFEEEWNHAASAAQSADSPVFRLVSFRLPELSARTADSRVVRLQHLLGIEGDGVSTRTLTQAFQLRVDAPHDSARVAVEILLDWASDLQDLVSVATGHTASFEFVHFFDPTGAGGAVDSGSGEVPLDFHAQWFAREDDGATRRRQLDLLFSFEQFGGIKGVARWLDVAARHRGALGRVMASRYMRSMFVSDRLLNCTAALESFDRDTIGYANSSLRTRLLRCAELAGAPFEALVGDVERWAVSVVVERDEVAHHFGRHVRKTGSTLYLSLSLYFLFVLCMLRESGASEQVVEAVPAHSEFRWLAPKVQAVI